MCAARLAGGASLADNNFSAYKKYVKRSAWEQMLADLETGLTGGTAVWDIDRG